jgi:hypothetical protein
MFAEVGQVYAAVDQNTPQLIRCTLHSARSTPQLIRCSPKSVRCTPQLIIIRRS